MHNTFIVQASYLPAFTSTLRVCDYIPVLSVYMYLQCTWLDLENEWRVYYIISQYVKNLWLHNKLRDQAILITVHCACIDVKCVTRCNHPTTLSGCARIDHPALFLPLVCSLNCTEQTSGFLCTGERERSWAGIEATQPFQSMHMNNSLISLIPCMHVHITCRSVGLLLASHSWPQIIINIELTRIRYVRVPWQQTPASDTKCWLSNQEWKYFFFNLWRCTYMYMCSLCSNQDYIDAVMLVKNKKLIQRRYMYSVCLKNLPMKQFQIISIIIFNYS